MNDTPYASTKDDAPRHELGRPRTAQTIALSDGVFFVCLAVIGGAYVLLIAGMLGADLLYMLRSSFWPPAAVATDDGAAIEDSQTDDEAGIPAETPPDDEQSTPSTSSLHEHGHAPADEEPEEIVIGSDEPPAEEELKRPRSILFDNPMVVALADEKIRYSIWLSMISCTLSAILSVFVAVPMGYLLSRHQFWGKWLLDSVLDIPIVLPPLVIGLSLLILFQFAPEWFARSVVYQRPAVVLAQFAVAAAFAVRTMRATFDHIDPRCERVALSLGCSRFEAFSWVVLPEAKRGLITAFTLAWARSLGEFGPLLIFAGATRMKTEVLSTSVFLEMNVGNIEAAVAVSMIMVIAAIVVLVVARMFGTQDSTVL